MLYDPETDIFSLRSGDFAPEYVHGDTPGRLGHTVFAGLLMREVRPEILVELGTDSGNSYFAYCRSAVKNKIAVRCCAIDSREGEPQTGKYGDAVFKTVNDYNKANYSSFSTLLRGRFDDFVNRYEDASIDLLHIDGFHSCDAVKHDFQTWIGKVRPGGLVILQEL